MSSITAMDWVKLYLGNSPDLSPYLIFNRYRYLMPIPNDKNKIIVSTCWVLSHKGTYSSWKFHTVFSVGYHRVFISVHLFVLVLPPTKRKNVLEHWLISKLLLSASPGTLLVPSGETDRNRRVDEDENSFSGGFLGSYCKTQYSPKVV